MANFLIIQWLIASISVFGNAEILFGPRDTEAVVEETVELHCLGTLNNVEWQHLALGASNTEHVYKDGFFFNGYKNRFSVKSTNDGRSTLIIQNVRPRDAGRFTCLENSETPSQAAAELIVFERFPSNEYCAVKYTCKPLCDSLKLSCEMKVHGNHIPSMLWIDNTGKTIDSTDNIINEITASTAKLKIDPHQAVLYTCRLQYQKISLISKYNWTHSAWAWESSYTHLTPGQQSSSESTPSVTLVLKIVCIAIGSAFLSAIASILIMKINKSKRKQFTTTEESQPLILYKREEADDTANFTPCTIENKGNPIHSLAALDNEVFITTRYGCVVEVFDLHGGEFKRSWTVGGLANPNDMAACPNKKIIFICDWKKTAEDNEIYCLDTEGKLLCQWFPDNHMSRIWITKDSNVLVADNWYNTIKEYTSTGALVNIVQTGQDKLHLWYAVKLDNGNFVACFGDANDDHREICILDKEGRVMKCLRSDSEMFHQTPLSVPRSLAIDKEENIYICDLHNFRIIVLNSELKLKRFLDTASDGYRLRGPLRICVHDFNNEGWLLVADSGKEERKWINGRVAVWKLQDVLKESVCDA